MPRAHSPAELQQINDAIVTVDDLMELNDSINRLETTDANDTEFSWMGAAALQARDLRASNLNTRPVFPS